MASRLPYFLLSRTAVFSRVLSLRPSFTRNIVSTPRFASPVASTNRTKASSTRGTKTTTSKTKKSPASKTKPASSKKRTPVKPKKAKVAPKKTVKQARLTAKERPPRPPGVGYIFFMRKYLAGQPKSANLEEARKTMTNGAAVWRELSETEKQAFRDEASAARVEYEKAREEYWRNADLSVVRRLNAEAVKKGKSKIHSKRADEDKRPVTAYLAYAQAVRNNPELTRKVDESGATGIQKAQVLVSLIGKQWTDLPPAEKQPYIQRAREEMEAWKAKHPSPSN